MNVAIHMTGFRHQPSEKNLLSTEKQQNNKSTARDRAMNDDNAEKENNKESAE